MENASERKVKDEKANDDFMEPNIMETVDLLEKSPIFVSMGQFLDGYELGREDVDNLLLSTLEEVENRNRTSNEPLDLKDYTRRQESNLEARKRDTGSNEENHRSSKLSDLLGPYMSLTTEENNCIKRLMDNTQQIIKSCCPVSLYQARIGMFMGTLSMEDMLRVFSLSRKATNYMHYKTMQRVPFFNELTTRYVYSTYLLDKY